MKHLTIVVPDAQSNLSTIACIVGAYEIFTTANKYRKENSRKELFTIELAGISKKTEVYDGLLTVKPHTTLAAINKTDLIIIPSLVHNQKAVKENESL